MSESIYPALIRERGLRFQAVIKHFVVDLTPLLAHYQLVKTGAAGGYAASSGPKAPAGLIE